MRTLWFASALAVELPHSWTALRVLAPGDAHARGFNALAPAQSAESLAETHTSEQVGRHSWLVRPSPRLTDALKWAVLAVGLLALANYVTASFRHRRLRQEVLSLQFLRPEVRLQPRQDLTVVERLAQENQVVLKMSAESFAVQSGQDRAEIMVGKLAKRSLRREGCLFAQCVVGIFSCVGSACGMITSCACGLPVCAKDRRKPPAGKWMVGIGHTQLEPAFQIKHEDKDGHQIVVTDVCSVLKAPVGSIQIDPCSWTAHVHPRKASRATLSFDGTSAGGHETVLRVLRDGRPVALLSRGVGCKGFAAGDLAKSDTYVDFGEVVDDDEKILLLAAAVFMD